MTDADKINICKALLNHGKSAGANGATLEDFHSAAKFAATGVRIDIVRDLMVELGNAGYFSSTPGPVILHNRRYTITQGGSDALELMA